MSGGSHELPGALGLTSAFPFVGRCAELELLHTLMPSAAGEGRRLALVAGEPGSGKSRLVREFGRLVASEGALILSGACDAVVRTPYGPFVEALDQLVRAVEPDELRSALGPGGGELSRLLPNLAAYAGDLAAPSEADPDTERHRLHTAVSDLLIGIGRGRPVLLVLEDGHWADAPTLLLLRHLARVGGDARLLLLATFRDTEVDVPRGLAETLADLRRSDEVFRIRLGGLSEADVTDFLASASGSGADPELRRLAAAIRGLTDGNAFLVCELWRALIETGTVEVAGGALRMVRPLAELGSPESVREVVGQRLSRLAPGTIELLELAATAGPEFDLDLIRRAAGLAESELLAALEEAIASGMIEEIPARRLACRFTHELVRRALYDGLPRARVAELHLRVGEALEADAGDSGRAYADLAHHFAVAAPLGGTGRAIGYSLAAGRAATAALAFDEAARSLGAAVELGIDDPAERGAVLVELGTVNNRAGQAAAALEAFTSAAAIARELEADQLLARAAIGYEDACWRPGITDAGSVELLEEAISALADASPGLRIDLLSGLARALQRRGDPKGALIRSSATELARRSGNRIELAKVLVRSYWSRGETPLEEILGMLSEAKQLGAELDDSEVRLEAAAWTVPTLVALCDHESARRENGSLLEMAERGAQPFMRHIAEHYGASIALCDGQLTRAEAMAVRSREWGVLLTGRDASGTYGIQMFSIRREQGRLAELAPTVRILAGREGPWRPGLVAMLAELGMEDDARRELARLADEGLDGFRDSLWLSALTYLTDACAAVGDEAMAALLYGELEPLAGANVMIGHLVSCYGAADRYLGMLASTLGEGERADEHFERAIELNGRMGARTWLAHSKYEYARSLLGRGRGASALARSLAGEAGALAEAIGMRALVSRIGALGLGTGVEELPAGLSPREVQILELVAGGASNREIGEALTISAHTAANHVRSILRKTGCANRTEAASYAHKHGLLSA